MGLPFFSINGISVALTSKVSQILAGYGAMAPRAMAAINEAFAETMANEPSSSIKSAWFSGGALKGYMIEFYLTKCAFVVTDIKYTGSDSHFFSEGYFVVSRGTTISKFYLYDLVRPNCSIGLDHRADALPHAENAALTIGAHTGDRRARALAILRKSVFTHRGTTPAIPFDAARSLRHDLTTNLADSRPLAGCTGFHAACGQHGPVGAQHVANDHGRLLGAFALSGRMAPAVKAAKHRLVARQGLSALGGFRVIPGELASPFMPQLDRGWLDLSHWEARLVAIAELILSVGTHDHIPPDVATGQADINGARMQFDIRTHKPITQAGWFYSPIGRPFMAEQPSGRGGFGGDVVTYDGQVLDVLGDRCGATSTLSFATGGRRAPALRATPTPRS